MNWNKHQTDILLQTAFVARTLLSLPVVDSCAVPTFATDGRRILANPTFVAEQDPRHIPGILVHECLHVMLGHHLRRRNRDPRRWNIACDYELNPFVIAAGYALPEGALLDAQYAGMCAERIYDLLPDDPQGKPLDDVQDAPGGDPLTGEPSREAVDAHAAATAAAQWGDLPGDLARKLAALLSPPELPLADRVAVWLSATVPTDDERWAPPDRRCRYLPSHDVQETGHVVACIDTSGSITDAQLRKFLSELQPLPAVGRLDVILGGCQVDQVFEDIGPSDLPQIAAGAADGGGTDFRPLLARADREQPDAIIYLTDALGEFGSPPGAPVLWAVIGDAAVPFGARMQA